MHRRPGRLGIIVGALTLTSVGQTRLPVEARPNGFASNSGSVSPPNRCAALELRSGVDSLDRLVSSTIAEQFVPALSLAVIVHGRFFTRAYGWADLENCVPATDTTLFGLGSISKHFTAVGALLLVRAGKLSLDDPITKYLPEGQGVWDSVTVRHLLTHTSGIPDYCGDDDKYPSITLDRASSPDTPTLVRQIAAAKLNFRPGNDWAYSNTGFLLLSVLIERVSGEPFPAYMREHVFLPAGMMQTRYYSPIALIQGRATPYHEDSAGLITHGPFISDQFSRWGDMGILSTARDMARWSIVMDSLRLLPPALWHAMWTPVRLNQGWTYPYGFGLFLLEDEASNVTVSHPGTFRVGYSSDFLRIPARGVSVVLLSTGYGARFHKSLLTRRIVGTVDPTLAPSVSVSDGPDPQPTVTHALRQFLRADDAAHGATPMTPAFRSLVFPTRSMQLLRKNDRLTFLRCTDRSDNPYDAYGTPATRACTYRSDGASGPSVVTFYLTHHGDVADVWVHD